MKFKITKEDGSEEIVEGVSCEKVTEPKESFFINMHGRVIASTKAPSIDWERLPKWNRFPSKEAAEMEVLRREAMAGPWRDHVHILGAISFEDFSIEEEEKYRKAFNYYNMNQK